MRIEINGKCKIGSSKIIKKCKYIYYCTIEFDEPRYFVCDPPAKIYDEKFQFSHYSIRVYPITYCTKNDLIDIRIYPENDDEKEGAVFCSGYDIRHRFIYHIRLIIFVDTSKGNNDTSKKNNNTNKENNEET